ncbi:DUF1259 domain-containing protein [Sphingobium scionense]
MGSAGLVGCRPGDRTSGGRTAGGVHRYSFPRSDLSVTLDGVTIKPSLALGSWAAFQPMGDEAMVMGDLVLTHDEVNPVLSRLLASGFTITALHNHLLRSSPATMYMHIAGHGDPVKLVPRSGKRYQPVGPRSPRRNRLRPAQPHRGSTSMWPRSTG